MRSLHELLVSRRRPEPAPDVGAAAERTAMAWQRTGLGLAGFAALLVHLAGRDLVLAIPGILGLVAALVVLLYGERRYTASVREIEACHSCMAQPMVVALSVGVVALCIGALGVVTALGM